MNARRHLTVFVLCIGSMVPIDGQDAPLLDMIVERLGVYLAEYESALGPIVADERYEQHEIRQRPLDTAVGRRRLDSEVAFLRLPGDREWFGIRDVRKVDGKTVAGTGTRLADLLKSPSTDLIDRAWAIVDASSRHNLGGRRTINMATVPLEPLCARNHLRVTFKLGGKERIGRVETQRVEYQEFDEPTIVQGTDGGILWSRGTAWVELDTGRVWRAELIVGPDRPGTFQRTTARVRVELVHHAALDMLVPKEMVEDFWIPWGRGSGRAQYSNFRRFTTSTRIIPQ